MIVWKLGYFDSKHYSFQSGNAFFFIIYISSLSIFILNKNKKCQYYIQLVDANLVSIDLLYPMLPSQLLTQLEH
jgi:hypothetical protein